MALESSAYYLNQITLLEANRDELLSIRSFLEGHGVSNDSIRTDLFHEKMDGMKYGQLHQELKEYVKAFSTDTDNIKWDITLRLRDITTNYEYQIETAYNNYRFASDAETTAQNQMQSSQNSAVVSGTFSSGNTTQSTSKSKYSAK